VSPVFRAVLAVFVGLLVAIGWGATAAQAKWLRAETAHFVLYSDGPESNLRNFAADLEDFDSLLRMAHGMDPSAPPPRKLDIYLVGGNKDLKRSWPGATDYVAGVYRASLGDIYAVAIRGERGSGNGQRFLFHEYVHHFMMQHFAAAYPAWLVEGYAEYFGATRIEDTLIEVGVAPQGRAANLANNTWISLSTIAAVAPPSRTGNGPDRVRGMYYAQSWLLTHYMLSDPARKARLGDYLLAIGRGEDPVKSLETALGMDLVSAEKALKQYLRATPGIRYKRTARPPADIVVTALPPSADALLLEAQRLKSGVPASERPAFLAEIRERAARFPGDRLADLTLARAEITFGDRSAGEAILTRRIATDARDADALWLMALSRIFAGDADRPRRAALYSEAGPWLGKAFAVDQNRYQILYNYAQSRSMTPDYPTDNTLTVLLKAHELAPQVAPIRLSAARALMKRGRFPAAIALLTPLANNPHGGALAEAAERLIAQARAGQLADAAAEPADEGPGDR